jgi:hypothetical protein
MSKTEILIRSLAGLLLIGSVFMAGYFGRSPWIILLFGLVFTILYLTGKQAAAAAWRSHGLAARLKILLPTFWVQIAVCGIFYLLGRGLDSFLHNHPIGDFNRIDLIITGTVLVAGLLLNKLISLLENNRISASNSVTATEPSNTSSTYVLSFEPWPITLDNFYTGVFYGHRTFRSPDEGEDAAAKTELPEAAKTTDAMIDAVEARLNIKLPLLLKQLYQRQNGGMVRNLWVPAAPEPGHKLENWRGVFSHDYCYLAPLERLDTLYTSYLDFMEEDEIEQDESIPKNAKRYIVLCQRYQDTTFLDYSQSTEQPRVGIIDFEGNDPHDVWFDSFDDFFKALKRGELVDI